MPTPAFPSSSRLAGTRLPARRPQTGHALRLVEPQMSQDGAAPLPTLDLLGGLRRHWPTLLLSTLAAVAIGVAYIALATPRYTASSAIFVDPRARKIVSEDVSSSGIGMDVALFESQIAIIGSDTTLRRVVVAEKLTADAEFVPPAGTGHLADLRSRLRGPGLAADPTDKALDALAKKIRIKRAQASYVVTVDVTTEQPSKSARIANAILKAYQDDQSAAKSDAAARVNAQIDGRLEELRNQVRLAEQAADAFKRANRIVTSEGGLLNEQQLTKLNTELAAVRAHRAASKARLDEMTVTLQRGVSPESLPEAMASPVVQRLREQLASAVRREAALASQLHARHPVMADAAAQAASVKSQIAAELRRIGEQARSDYQIASNREREILKALGTSESEVSETTTAQIRLRELEREADASREVLRAFLARAKETQEQQNLTVTDARVITPAAVPSRATGPGIPSILAASAAGGLALALGGLFLAGSFSPRPAPSAAPAPMARIASLPTLSTQRGSPIGPAEVMTSLAAPSNACATAFHAAVGRAASDLRARAPRHGPQTILLTSATPAAGVSLTALALAYTRALAGDRVLLVDAASADPMLSEQLAGNLDADEPCVLDSKEHLAAITSHEPATGLAFLPIALADLSTLDDVQCRRLASGIADLATDYDLVVIDGGAIDGTQALAVLAGLATTIVLVQRTGEVAGTHAITDALQVDRSRIAGCIVTMTRG